METILLYYKDFVHLPAELLDHTHQLQEYGFGLRQSSRVSLVEGADMLQQHIGSVGTPIPLFTPSLLHTLTFFSHLSSLILVESFDLDFVLTKLDEHRYNVHTLSQLSVHVHHFTFHSSTLEDHHLFKSDSSTTMQVWRHGLLG